MINIKRKQDCCGCTSCASNCPRGCITLAEDREGFKYPIVNADACTNCGACEKVCPVQNKSNAHRIMLAYAAQIKDKDVLLASSSGGMFSLLASHTLSKGGVVFGAVWADEHIIHTYIESETELYRMRGSKYAQSDLGSSFQQAHKFLRNGRYVLFTGTPCQIGGLKTFLHKDYDNLLTVDVACHGAPSPKVLSLYMKELKAKYGEDTQLDFRSKTEGWQDYKVTAFSGDKHFFYENQKENIFMRGFLHELYSRPSCHECVFKVFQSQSDITLADFWGIKDVLPELDSYNGVSLVLIHTDKGRITTESLSTRMNLHAVETSVALRQNGALLHSEEAHPQRRDFFDRIEKCSISDNIERSLVLTRLTKFKLIVNSLLKKYGLT